MDYKIFNIADFRDMKLDVDYPLYVYNNNGFRKRKFSRTEVDKFYDKTTKKSHRVCMLIEGQWYDMDDASNMELKETDPVGPCFVLLYKKNP